MLFTRRIMKLSSKNIITMSREDEILVISESCFLLTPVGQKLIEFPGCAVVSNKTLLQFLHIQDNLM